jgi:hypothetical protein
MRVVEPVHSSAQSSDLRFHAVDAPDNPSPGPELLSKLEKLRPQRADIRFRRPSEIVDEPPQSPSGRRDDPTERAHDAKTYSDVRPTWHH